MAYGILNLFMIGYIECMKVIGRMTKEGNGTIYYVNGEEFEGDWKNDRVDG